MDSDIPNRLFKYRTFDDRTLDMLVADELYFADPGTFNDPLDVQPTIKIDLGNEQLERVWTQLFERRALAEKKAAAEAIKYKGSKTIDHIQKLIRREARSRLEHFRHLSTDPDLLDLQDPESFLLGIEIGEELIRQYEKGICSLAERHDCPLMWSHYGDQHRGVCVGYSVPERSKTKTQKVIYGGSREVEASKNAEMLNSDTSARQHVDQAVLLRKADGWNYEQEWRLIDNRGVSPSPLEMEEVIFGIRCKLSVKFSVVTAFEKRDRQIDFFEMSVVDKGFDLKKRRVDIRELKAELPRRSRDPHEIFSAIVEPST